MYLHSFFFPIKNVTYHALRQFHLHGDFQGQSLQFELFGLEKKHWDYLPVETNENCNKYLLSARLVFCLNSSIFFFETRSLTRFIKYTSFRLPNCNLRQARVELSTVGTSKTTVRYSKACIFNKFSQRTCLKIMSQPGCAISISSIFVSKNCSKLFGKMQKHFQACLLLRVRIIAETTQRQTSLRSKGDAQ